VSFPYFKKALGKVRSQATHEETPKATPKTVAVSDKPKKHPPAETTAEKKPEKKTKRKQKRKKGPDWQVIKKDYMEWRYATLAEVAADVGVHYNNSDFKTLTAGWKSQRSKLPKPDLPACLDALAKERAVQKAQDIYADALEIQYCMMDLLKKTSKCRGVWGEPDKSPWHSQMAIQVAIDMQKALEKIMPAIKGLENLQAVHVIFDELSAGGDIVKAAFELAKLGVTMPKPIEIMLTKHKPDDAPPDDGQLITDEAIMARRAELLAEIQTERVEFVRERKKLVATLKAETTDSFKAQKEVENGA
jgi:hypothetical protein